MNMERRIRVAGSFVIAGMLVELMTLIWSHPTAFVIFVIVGGLSTLVGVIYHLLALIRVKA